jgi:hypothetical protein
MSGQSGARSGGRAHRRPDLGSPVMLLALTVATGATDAISFLALGGVFTSVITANLALLGVSAVTLAPGLAVNAVVAIAGFVTGVLVSGRLARYGQRTGRRERSGGQERSGVRSGGSKWSLWRSGGQERSGALKWSLRRFGGLKRSGVHPDQGVAVLGAGPAGRPARLRARRVRDHAAGGTRAARDVLNWRCLGPRGLDREV